MNKEKKKSEKKVYPEHQARWHLCRWELNQIAWRGYKDPREMAGKSEEKKKEGS